MRFHVAISAPFLVLLVIQAAAGVLAAGPSEQASTSAPQGAKGSPSGLLWNTEFAQRIPAYINPKAALEEVGGLRYLYETQDWLSLYSQNFLRWLQHHGKGALEEMTDEHPIALRIRLSNRIKWFELQEEYERSLQLDELAFGGPTESTLAKKKELDAMLVAQESHPSGEENLKPQKLKLRFETERRIVGKLIDRFENFAHQLKA